MQAKSGGRKRLTKVQPAALRRVEWRRARKAFSKPGHQKSMSERSFREPRQRGFGDRGFASRRPGRFEAPGPRRQLPSGPPMGGTIKWYNPEKGFGFVTLDDGSSDAFLHASVIERSGHDAAEFQPGARLQVRIGQGLKGPQVSEILEVDTSTVAVSPKARPADRFAERRPAEGKPSRMTGTVKWYSPAKRFGFVAVDSGRGEVFVHAEILQRSGISTLSEGQRVELEVVEGRKGLEAVSVSVR
jgi:cold shock protein